MDHSQRTHITQTATAETTIKVTQQQLLNAELLEMGDDDLMVRVGNELIENEALEEGRDDSSQDEELSDDSYDDLSDDITGTSDIFDGDADDDELPVYTPGGSGQPGVEMPIGDTKSFVNELKSQIGDYELADEKQGALVEYLIDSLNDNGFIDRPLSSISDDLVFYHNIDASKSELEDALKVLQQFDPPGIGARDLQECMLLQLNRKIENTPTTGNLQRLTVLELARQVVENHFNLFKSKDQKALLKVLDVDDDMFDEVLQALRKLNPRPGLSLNEGAADRAQTIVPDFIIKTSMEGDISFYMRGSRIPSLHVSQSCRDMIADYAKAKLSSSQKEGLKYMKSNLERAENFIQALQNRRDTLYRTMKAIIRRQRQFMLTQDDNDLQPLKGSDIAKDVGVNDSTISRAVKNRYASLDGTIYPLKSFFLRTRKNAKGTDVLKTQVVIALQEVIDAEDKSNPLSDAKIADALERRGVNIKRRTVAKYRDQLGIPEAKMRKKL